MTQISFMTSAWKLLILRTGPKTSLISHCTFSRKFNYQVRFNSLFCSHCNLTISSPLTIPQGQRELENILLRPCGTIIWKFIFLAIDLKHLKSDMYFSWYQTSILSSFQTKHLVIKHFRHDEKLPHTPGSRTMHRYFTSRMNWFYMSLKISSIPVILIHGQ